MSVYSSFSNPGWAWLKKPPLDPHRRPSEGMEIVRIKPGQVVWMEESDSCDFTDIDAESEAMYWKARAGF